MRTGKAKVFTGDEITADAIMASACLPEYFHAVEIDGEAYWDGGFMGNPPLYPLFHGTDCEDVLLVEINPVEVGHLPKSAFSIANRINEITFNSNLLRELRVIEFVRRLIDEGKLDDHYMKVRIHEIRAAPDMVKLSASSKLNLKLDFWTISRGLAAP